MPEGLPREQAPSCGYCAGSVCGVAPEGWKLNESFVVDVGT